MAIVDITGNPFFCIIFINGGASFNFAILKWLLEIYLGNGMMAKEKDQYGGQNFTKHLEKIVSET